MKHSGKLLLSTTVTFLFFLVVIAFLKPLLNSGDDAIIMYTFSGGFGVAPSALVDYSYGWHFILGAALAHMFFWFPSVNWYTVFLLALHFSACTLLLHTFFYRTSRVVALVGYTMFALFFETIYLLSLSYTNTAIVCTLAGNVMLVHYFSNHGVSKKYLFAAFLLLLMAGLLRFHAWAFAEVFFLPFLFCLRKQATVHLVLYKLLLGGLVLLLFVVHINYYKKHIPGWAHEEGKKQVLYSLYNKPKDSRKAALIFASLEEQEFFQNGFFYDTTLFPQKRLHEITTQLVRVRDFSQPNDVRVLYWNFMESRVYLFLILLALCFLTYQQQYGVLKKFAVFGGLTAFIYTVLFLFYKLTGYMFVTFFSANWLVLFLLATMYKAMAPPSKSHFIFYLFFAFSAAWMCKRIGQINETNTKNHKKWICAYKAITQNAEMLNIAVNNQFPLDYISITNVPDQFQLRNFLSVAQFPLSLYHQKVQQMGLHNVMQDIVDNEKVVLVGPQLQSLQAYYRTYKQQSVTLHVIDAQQECVHQYRVKRQTH